MSIEQSFRNTKELLKPSDVSMKYHKVYHTIIVTFQSKVLSGLLESGLVEEIKDRTFGSSHSKHAIYEVVGETGILFFLCPVGAPIAVGILEEISYAMGIQNIVMYGTCGVLDKNITAGKIIVPTKAYRDEGTSYHYQKAADFIDVVNADVVSQILNDYQVEYINGFTWTTDAFYRETKEIFDERKKQGCIAVEMEVSAVQAFVLFRGLSFYNFLYGADNLDSTKWDKRILGNLSVNQRVEYFLVAKQIALNVSNRK